VLASISCARRANIAPPRKNWAVKLYLVSAVALIAIIIAFRPTGAVFSPVAQPKYCTHFNL
jgi:hypothetical protein